MFNPIVCEELTHFSILNFFSERAVLICEVSGSHLFNDLLRHGYIGVDVDNLNSLVDLTQDFFHILNGICDM